MGSKAERSGSFPSPRWRSSANQEARKATRDRGDKIFGEMDRALKAQLRRERKQELLEHQQFGMKLLPSRCTMQFDGALKRVLVEDTATPQDMAYIDRHGQEIDSYFTKRGNLVTITIVDFTPPNSQNSS